MKAPKSKVSAPTGVSGELLGEEVSVSWDLVDGAVAYQVEAVGVSPESDPVEESQFVAAPPALIDARLYTSLVIAVRGIGAPKQEKQPVQAGRKGRWSEPLVVQR